MTTVPRRVPAHLVALWSALACLRWLAALPIASPRIFRDELLHWQFAKAIAFHKQFVVAGQAVDYPAVLYPALLSVVAHLSDPSVAFRAAQGLNAVLMSAVVLFAYGLAREFCEPRAALLAAAIAGLAPGCVYSALIMEENVYYPLFVLSCWLCFRVLAEPSTRNAAVCAIALCLTYFAKPVAVPLVAAYTATVLALAALELHRARVNKNQVSALAIRLAPALLFGIMLVVRHALAAQVHQVGPESGLLLSRFYAEELGGPIIPPLVPLAMVAAALFVALTLGTGVAPMAAFFGSWSTLRHDRRRMQLACFATVVAAVYIAAAARHTMVMNDVPKILERYVFAAGPLFTTLFFAERPPRLGPKAIVLVCAIVVLVAGPLGYFTLSPRTWGSAPSLTVAADIRNVIGGRVAVVAIGSFALLTCVGVLRARGDTLASFAWLAAALVVLNAGWYATVYRQAYLDSPLRLVHAVQDRLTRGERVAIIVQDTGDPLRLTSEQAKYWLDERAVVYWAGEGPPPWYAEMSGPAAAAVNRAAASYIVAAPAFAAVCPGARELTGLQLDRGFPITLFRIEPVGCDTACTADKKCVPR